MCSVILVSNLKWTISCQFWSLPSKINEVMSSASRNELTGAHICILHADQCTLHILHILHTAYCTLRSAHCTLHPTPWSLHIAHCTHLHHVVHCTEYCTLLLHTGDWTAVRAEKAMWPRPDRGGVMQSTTFRRYFFQLEQIHLAIWRNTLLDLDKYNLTETWPWWCDAINNF